ncbi:MAG: hypothetical protein DMG41_34110 [Acidobacteria bacterium]|nr:MAG: hypothetical protein AUH13_23805 [Acidobacteria bacterium 13_2_20CM_58_27]PYT81961.1 MAG: hypothetical protein DMG41_34110 [Acidobacteriota bacterium]
MKYEGLRKLRWLFCLAAAIGIAYTPSAILTAISSAKSDHRLIIPFAGAVVIRLLVIGFFLKIWWETKKKSQASKQGNATAK